MLRRTDIVEHRFNRAFRGFDPVEVRYFLEMLADEFGRLQELIGHLEPIQQQWEKLKIRNPEEIIAEATQRATTIVIDAERLAREALENARNEKQNIEQSIANLRRERDHLSKSLRQFILAQRDLLKALEIDGHALLSNIDEEWIV